MAPLKSMEKEYPLIDSHFQSFCASHAIFSLEDFLLYDLHSLIASADNHSSSITFKQVYLLFNAGILVRSEMYWLRIDALLGGGLRAGQLTELVGPSSSGKTQACLTSASTVAKNGGSVIYFDTGNSFSPQHIAHLVGQTSGYVIGNQAEPGPLQKVMERIICYSVFDIYQMFDVLQQLKINLKSKIVEPDRRVQLLIVDSISSLITPILGGSGPQGHALMISAGYLLKKLADEHNIAVLVTNHMVAGEGGTSKPALGESWKSVPHIRLLLSREYGSNVCNVSTLKHPSVVCLRHALWFVFGKKKGLKLSFYC
ncbi:DNA repair protein RAD51 homolog 4-like [Arachis ipaensis]|uniref:DNA repair protein RAD51 homolog 4-like n=1 Tax=Arachis ipaensis TaxID=130454 RepID=UPI000A2B2F17|nr:DNA repair protein RAD51 homolog 4-like [Arachis ipaensis]